jgi:hypothetical protein
MALNDLKALNCGILGETGVLPARYMSDLRMINPQFDTVFTNCEIRPNEL